VRKWTRYVENKLQGGRICTAITDDESFAFVQRRLDKVTGSIAPHRS
jgi:hypothetical protein